MSKEKKWRRTVDDLLAADGRDLEWLCRYVGAAYNPNYVSFYQKLPKKRELYIGVGMAFHQTLRKTGNSTFLSVSR